MSSNGVVFVTGGNRGIGLAIAQRFAQDGFKVAISYREQKPAEDFYMVKADVTDSKSIDAAIDEVSATAELDRRWLTYSNIASDEQSDEHEALGQPF